MNRKTVSFIITLLFGLLIVASACSKSDDQRKFEQQAFSEPSGITETNASGDITGNADEDDWRVGPMYRGLIQVAAGSADPPFPNPVPYNQSLNIQINFNSGQSPVNSLYIRKFRFPSDPLTLLASMGEDQLTSFNNIPIPGSNISQSSGSEGRGLYRLLIYDGKQNLISYGDVEIE